eukprot:11194687-Lingulodinium_polyedra.AAC.1
MPRKRLANSRCAAFCGASLPAARCAASRGAHGAFCGPLTEARARGQKYSARNTVGSKQRATQHRCRLPANRPKPHA